MPDAADRAWFEDNPLPMWIFDPQTFSFLEVNNAAVRQYGYTREEFLRMTICEIRPAEDVAPLVARVKSGFPGRTQTTVGRHLTKSGRLLEVEIYAQQGSRNGRLAEFVQVRIVGEVSRGLAELPITRREHEVLQLLADGRSSKAVASTLGISVYTAETHRRNLMQKLGLHSVAQLTRYAIRNQLLSA